MKFTTEIITGAHADAKKMQKIYGAELDYRLTFGAALKNRIEEAMHPMTAAEEYAALIEKPEELVKRIENMARYCRRKNAAANSRTVTMAGNIVNERKARAAGEIEYGKTEWVDRFAWMLDKDDMTACVNEAFCFLARYIAEGTHADKPLSSLIYRAVNNAAQKIDRAEKRNARALKYDGILGENGEVISREYVVLKANPGTMELTAASPEAYALFMDGLDAVCKDNTDRRILLGWGIGLNEREIAADIGAASRNTVNKRKNKMKERRAEYLREA